MPSIDIKFWNIQDAGYQKTVQALAALHVWPPPAVFTPQHLLIHSTAVAVCEAKVYSTDFDTGLGPNALRNVLHIAPMQLGLAVAGGMVASRCSVWRTDPRERRAQLGYAFLITPGGVYNSLDRPIPPLTRWEATPRNIGVHARPLVRDVRNRASRRLAVYHIQGGFHVYYFHAISGGGALTVYDLHDHIKLLMLNTIAAGAIVGVLIGDLNLSAMTLHGLMPALPLPAPFTYGGIKIGGPLGAIIANNQICIVCPANPTHIRNITLDYAIVANHSGGPLHWSIVDGWSIAGAALGTSGPGWPGGAGINCPIPGIGGHSSDHKPIMLRLRF